jgi:hypothetical protein
MAKPKNKLTDAPMVDTAEATIIQPMPNEPTTEETRLPNANFGQSHSEPLPIDAKELVVPSVEPALDESASTTQALEFEEPTPPVKIENVLSDVEMISVSKKALFKMMVALSRGQVQYYTSFQIVPRIGDLFNIGGMVNQQTKWNEIKEWVEAQKL